jgi:hypothetical protein
VTMFVSYARADNDPTVLRHLENLLFARAFPLVSDMLSHSPPYIDDLHHHRFGADRHEAVLDALRTARYFLAVESARYRKTPWTVYEFDLARDRKIPIFMLSSDRKVIDLYGGQNHDSRT